MRSVKVVWICSCDFLVFEIHPTAKFLSNPTKSDIDVKTSDKFGTLFKMAGGKSRE